MRFSHAAVASIAASLILVLLPTSESSAQPVPDPTDLDADGLPGVAEPPPGATQGPEVFALQGTARLLVDRTHHESFHVGGFTDFLVSQGWTVQSNTSSPITDELLDVYDVLIIPPSLYQGPYPEVTPFTPAEQAAVNGFLASGGGLWLFHEYRQPATGINSLSITYGATFRNDMVVDSTHNEGRAFWPTIHTLASHPITQGVASYGYYAGSCLQVTAPAIIVGQGDDDASSSTCLSFPPTLAVYESGLGRVVFSGDSTPLHPSYYPENLRDEEELLLQNIANWLAGFPPTATEATSWGSIKALYR